MSVCLTVCLTVCLSHFSRQYLLDFSLKFHEINRKITWLDFNGKKLFFLPNFTLKFFMCFFKVKHTIGHISRMVGPIDVKRKGGASVRSWVNYVTLTFDPTHDLDLLVSRSKFEIALSWPVGIHGGVDGCTVYWLGWLQTSACRRHI